MFVPHQFKTTIAVQQPPQIIISQEAHKQMWQYVNQCDVEIGWLGVVERDGLRFTIRDIFLPQQDVTLVTTEITNEGLVQLAQEVLQRDDGMEIWPKMLFWGHSHVNMRTLPSSVDDKQMGTFEDNGVPYFIRGIFNKHGDASFDLFLYEEGIVIHDVPWTYELSADEELSESVQKEIETKLNRKSLLKSPFRPQWFNKHQFDLYREDDDVEDEDEDEDGVVRIVVDDDYEDETVMGWTTGDRVVVQVKDVQCTGTISGFKGYKALIDYDDGDEGSCPCTELELYDDTITTEGETDG